MNYYGMNIGIIISPVPYPYSKLATWFQHSSGNGYKAFSVLNAKVETYQLCANEVQPSTTKQHQLGTLLQHLIKSLHPNNAI